MLGAAICAVIFRINLPIALLITLYTNPFTIVPLYLVAFEIGKAVIGSTTAFTAPPTLHGDFYAWILTLIQWIIGLGKPLALGLLLLASLLAATGYLLTRMGWTLWLIRSSHRRKTRRC